MAKSFTIDFDGERTWTINGQSFRVPTHIDRGAWSARGSYEKGDGVSYGGSWWICKDAATTDRPGSSSAWRLAVKKGRDGKDAA